MSPSSSAVRNGADDAEAIPEQDCPGIYRVMSKAGLGDYMEVGEVSAIIYAGQEIAALEVVHDEENHRIRARISRPAGWVSLLDTKNGFRWAEWDRNLSPKDFESEENEDEDAVMPQMTATPTFTERQASFHQSAHQIRRGGRRGQRQGEEDGEDEDRFQVGRGLPRSRGRTGSDETLEERRSHLPSACSSLPSLSEQERRTPSDQQRFDRHYKDLEEEEVKALASIDEEEVKPLASIDEDVEDESVQARLAAVEAQRAHVEEQAALLEKRCQALEEGGHTQRGGEVEELRSQLVKLQQEVTLARSERDKAKQHATIFPEDLKAMRGELERLSSMRVEMERLAAAASVEYCRGIQSSPSSPSRPAPSAVGGDSPQATHAAGELFKYIAEDNEAGVRAVLESDTTGRLLDTATDPEHGGGALHTATRLGSEKVAFCLLEYVHASSGQQRELFEQQLDLSRLREHRFLDGPNFSGKSALAQLMTQDAPSETLVSRLLAARADPLRRDANGATPFHEGARHGHHKLLEVIMQVDASADVQATREALLRVTDNAGQTSLHYAAAAGHQETVRVLLSAKIDAAAADRQGHTPAQVAQAAGHSDIVALLIRAQQGSLEAAFDLPAPSAAPLAGMLVGSMVVVADTIEYTYVDFAKNYQLPVGLQGIVESIDEEGDAEVNWVGLGCKWLCKEHFGQIRLASGFSVGARVVMTQPVVYECQQPASSYELRLGQRGVVEEMDRDGDAAVRWEGLGTKWLRKEDFPKVALDPAVSPVS